MRRWGRRPAERMKKTLLFLLILLSLAVLGAHFLRDGNMPLVVACLILIALLPVRSILIARLAQLALVLGSIEWLWTLYRLLEVRIALGQPYMRMVVILAVVAALTLSAALAFRTRTLTDFYRSGSGRAS